jgi:hypothetical protein
VVVGWLSVRLSAGVVQAEWGRPDVSTRALVVTTHGTVTCALVRFDRGAVDFEAALAFYRDALGLPERAASRARATPA